MKTGIDWETRVDTNTYLLRVSHTRHRWMIHVSTGTCTLEHVHQLPSSTFVSFTHSRVFARQFSSLPTVASISSIRICINCNFIWLLNAWLRFKDNSIVSAEASVEATFLMEWTSSCQRSEKRSNLNTVNSMNVSCITEQVDATYLSRFAWFYYLSYERACILNTCLYSIGQSHLRLCKLHFVIHRRGTSDQLFHLKGACAAALREGEWERARRERERELILFEEDGQMLSFDRKAWGLHKCVCDVLHGKKDIEWQQCQWLIWMPSWWWKRVTRNVLTDEEEELTNPPSSCDWKSKWIFTKQDYLYWVIRLVDSRENKASEIASVKCSGSLDEWTTNNKHEWRHLYNTGGHLLIYRAVSWEGQKS